MKELTDCYNDGLWWLTVPNVQFSWQMIFDSIDNDLDLKLRYYLPKNKAQFIDYSYDDPVITLQAIHHEHLIKDIEGWYDNYDDSYNEYDNLQQEDEEWDTTVYDPWCSESVYE